ncbi:MAG: hypothetical protein HYS17_01765 [Micavibrio aeruginosavorus]|uniref:Uncharacterized protein n=1 Tax=Micavibrio aeruginosavorus TaxID=349221 RepID=A0A7T5UIC5_9BACT|nr:MAG: hypothetical protein HYS17_01765 [Micavibrio aeruginosavorus]
MEQIIFDKPKPLWLARVAFGAAAVGLAVAAWWLTKGDYEPARVLTPEEGERLKNDPARNPGFARENWENAFIREKVPGEDRVSAKNAWVKAAEPKLKLGTGHEFEPRDDFEKEICNLETMRMYREAKEAWEAFKNKPATATESFLLLQKVGIAGGLALDVTGVSYSEFKAQLARYGQLAAAEIAIKTQNLNPDAVYGNYRLYSDLISALTSSVFNRGSHLSFIEAIEEVNPGIDYETIRSISSEWRQKAEEQAIDRVIALYNQGVRPGTPEAGEFYRLYREFSLSIVAYEKNGGGQVFFIRASKGERGLKPGEAQGISNLYYEIMDERGMALEKEDKLYAAYNPTGCQRQP